MSQDDSKDTRKVRLSAEPFCIGNAEHGLYLIRWTILKLFGWTAKFHVFVRSDADCHHDHPWAFWTLVLAGRYTEETLHEDGRITRIERHAPSLAFRKASHRHRVILTAGPCLTFIITKPREREWGFWKKGRMTPWRQFFASPFRCDDQP